MESRFKMKLLSGSKEYELQVTEAEYIAINKDPNLLLAYLNDLKVEKGSSERSGKPVAKRRRSKSVGAVPRRRRRRSVSPAPRKRRKSVSPERDECLGKRGHSRQKEVMLKENVKRKRSKSVGAVPRRRRKSISPEPRRRRNSVSSEPRKSVSPEPRRRRKSVSSDHDECLGKSKRHSRKKEVMLKENDMISSPPLKQPDLTPQKKQKELPRRISTEHEDSPGKSIDQDTDTSGDVSSKSTVSSPAASNKSPQRILLENVSQSLAPRRSLRHQKLQSKQPDKETKRADSSTTKSSGFLKEKLSKSSPKVVSSDSSEWSKEIPAESNACGSSKLVTVHGGNPSKIACENLHQKTAVLVSPKSCVTQNIKLLLSPVRAPVVASKPVPDEGASKPSPQKVLSGSPGLSPKVLLCGIPQCSGNVTAAKPVQFQSSLPKNRSPGSPLKYIAVVPETQQITPVVPATMPKSVSSTAVPQGTIPKTIAQSLLKNFSIKVVPSPLGIPTYSSTPVHNLAPQLMSLKTTTAPSTSLAPVVEIRASCTAQNEPSEITASAALHAKHATLSKSSTQSGLQTSPVKEALQLILARNSQSHSGVKRIARGSPVCTNSASHNISKAGPQQGVCLPQKMSQSESPGTVVRKASVSVSRCMTRRASLASKSKSPPGILEKVCSPGASKGRTFGVKQPNDVSEGSSPRELTFGSPAELKDTLKILSPKAEPKSNQTSQESAKFRPIVGILGAGSPERILPVGIPKGKPMSDPSEVLQAKSTMLIKKNEGSVSLEKLQDCVERKLPQEVSPKREVTKDSSNMECPENNEDNVKVSSKDGSGKVVVPSVADAVEDKALSKDGSVKVLIPHALFSTSQSVTQVKEEQVAVESVISPNSPEKHPLCSPKKLIQSPKGKTVNSSDVEKRKVKEKLKRPGKDRKGMFPKIKVMQRKTRQTAAGMLFSPETMTFTRKINLPKYRTDISDISNFKIVHPLMSLHGPNLLKKVSSADTSEKTVESNLVEKELGTTASVTEDKIEPSPGKEFLLPNTSQASSEDADCNVLLDPVCDVKPMDTSECDSVTASLENALPTTKRKRGRPQKSKSLPRETICTADSDVTAPSTTAQTVSSVANNLSPTPGAAKTSKSVSSAVPDMLSSPVGKRKTPEISQVQIEAKTVMSGSPETVPSKIVPTAFGVPALKVIKTLIGNDLDSLCHSLVEKTDKAVWNENVILFFLSQCSEQKDSFLNPAVDDLNFENIVEGMNKVFAELNTTSIECNEKWWKLVSIYELLVAKKEFWEQCHLSPKNKLMVVVKLCEASSMEFFSPPETTKRKRSKYDRVSSMLKFLNDCLKSEVPTLIASSSAQKTSDIEHQEDLVEFITWWISNFQYLKHCLDGYQRTTESVICDLQLYKK